MATAQLSPDAPSRRSSIKSSPDKSGGPANCSAFWRPCRSAIRTSFFPPDTLRYIAAKLDIPLSRISAWPRSMRSSTLSRRVTTRSASAAERPATPAIRARCWRALRLELGLGIGRRGSGRRRQACHDYPRQEVHHANRRLFRPVCAGAGGRDQPPHLRSRQRTHLATRGPIAGTGE